MPGAAHARASRDEVRDVGESAAALSIVPRAAHWTPARRLGLLQALTGALLVGLTVATLTSPAFRLHAHAPTLRAPLEVFGACLVVLGAVVLALPSDEDVRLSRNAFLSGLLVLGLSNASLALQLALGDAAEVGVTASRHASWLAARYVVGVFFLLAVLERPRVDGRWYAAAALLAWLGLEAAAALGLAVPVEVVGSEPDAVVGPLPAALIAVQAVPAGLFLVAATEQDFRAVVTHELATPVATVNAFGHVLRRRLADVDDPHVNEAVDGLLGEAARLRALVDRMEELRGLELSGFRCDLHATWIGPVLEDLQRFGRTTSSTHDLRLSYEPARVLADPVRVGQALRNVLANALRHAPPGSGVEITGGRARPGRYAITVTDHGPGIPVRERERVLRLYGRGSASRGQGIGLYVARRIAEAHGDTIHIDGTEGTAVTLTLELVA